MAEAQGGGMSDDLPTVWGKMVLVSPSNRLSDMQQQTVQAHAQVVAEPSQLVASIVRLCVKMHAGTDLKIHIYVGGLYWRDGAHSLSDFRPARRRY